MAQAIAENKSRDFFKEVKKMCPKDVAAPMIDKTYCFEPQDVANILLGTITSIPKDNRENVLSSNNYRGIPLCSAISKIIDIVIIQRHQKILSSSDMQYAFKGKHSTVMCSLMLKEVVNG